MMPRAARKFLLRVPVPEQPICITRNTGPRGRRAGGSSGCSLGLEDVPWLLTSLTSRPKSGIQNFQGSGYLSGLGPAEVARNEEPPTSSPVPVRVRSIDDLGPEKFGLEILKIFGGDGEMTVEVSAGSEKKISTRNNQRA